MEDKIKVYKLLGVKFSNRNNHLERKDKSKRGFTLIELIVVMAVIAILVLLAAPKFLGYTQKAQETKYIHTAKVIETALDAYLINGGEIGNGLTVVDSTMLTESVTSKNLINTKGYMVSVDTETYYELTDDFIKTNLDIKMSASRSTSFIIEANAAKSLKAPNAVYASSEGAVIINKEQKLKGYVDSVVVGEDNETPVGEDIETPVEETPIFNCTTDATPREYFTFDALTGTITAYSLTGPKDVVIPCEIDGVKVLTIGNTSFTSKGLTSVVIPNGITAIGSNAFSTNSLTSLVIPEGVAKIDIGAFSNNKLVSVTIPTSLKTTSYKAFDNNQTTITTITIGDTTTIDTTDSGLQSFRPWYDAYAKSAGTYRRIGTTNMWNKDNCDSSYIVDKDGKIVAYMGAEKAITIPKEIIMDGVTLPVLTIGDTVFANKSLTSVVIQDNITTIGASAFSSNLITNLVIPNSVTTIGNGAFSNNKLVSIEIPSSLTTTGSNAFNSNQTTLATITIGANITIDTSDSGLQSFRPWYDKYAKEAGTYRRIGTTSMWNKDNCDSSYIIDKTGKIIAYMGLEKDITIPKEIIREGITYPVSSIGSTVFYNKGITSVVIPNGITAIGSSAFSMNSLTNLVIPEGVTKIDSGAFSTNKLISITLPASLAIISDTFDNNQTTITTITIGADATIDTSDSGLQYFRPWYDKYAKEAGTYRRIGTTSMWNKDNCDSSYIIDKAGQIIAYMGSEKAITIPNEIIRNGIAYPVLSIGSMLFYGKGLTSVVIPNSVVSIKDNAFYNNSLTNVTIPSSATSIGSYAFESNYLTSITIPSSVTSIGSYAFRSNGPSKNSGTFTTIGAKTWVLDGTTWK